MFPHQVPTCPVFGHFLPADIYFLQCDRGSTRAHVTVGPPRGRIDRANTYIDSQLYKGFCAWFSLALTTRGPCGPAATPLGECRSTRPQSPSMGEERQSRRGWGDIACICHIRGEDSSRELLFLRLGPSYFSLSWSCSDGWAIFALIHAIGHQYINISLRASRPLRRPRGRRGPAAGPPGLQNLVKICLYSRDS